MHHLHTPPYPSPTPLSTPRADILSTPPLLLCAHSPIATPLCHHPECDTLEDVTSKPVKCGGIEHLVALQRLSLYYNLISSPAELFRLRVLPALSDADFRLNPVVKSEPGYRLFMVHLLPGLRRLDDRPVRESEREASQLHFASEESLDSKQSFPTAFRVERPRHSRATCADPSAGKCLVMDTDDEAVLNLIAECEWDLSNPPGSRSSSQKEREVSFQGSQVESWRPLSPLSAQHQCGDSRRKGCGKTSGARGVCAELRLQDPRCGEPPAQPFPPRPDSVDDKDPALSQKSSLSTQKVLNPLPAAEKHRKRRMPGGRFQAPADQECLSCLEAPDGPSSPEESLSRRNGSEAWSEGTFSHPVALGPGQQGPPSTSGSGEVSRGVKVEGPLSLAVVCPVQVCPRRHLAAPPGKKATLEVLALEALLDLVDRYWSGCRSLHSNKVFLAQARHILSSVQEFTATQDSSTTVSEEISYLTLENKSLYGHLAELQQQHSVRMHEVVSELGDTRREMDHLRQHLDRALEESSSLKSLLRSVKEAARSADPPAALSVHIAALWRTCPVAAEDLLLVCPLDSGAVSAFKKGVSAAGHHCCLPAALQADVKSLSGEVLELRQHLEHDDRVQELTQLLQESHRSLVSTNERLLQELGQVRAQHRVEVEQLHWSYKELKKTLALFPAGVASPGRR
ncbi:Centrosomal protein of 72 kDa [Camelus dromedarius]|uniref:Centrosomal protein of 72 kDa n=1 Tax=Camelus dromedarius TaxID=9838 RepID=A0A5N4ECX6_CAMDR|nr:Centrosomal protein of 72 kDa [Camelus dromedarius]